MNDEEQPRDVAPTKIPYSTLRRLGRLWVSLMKHHYPTAPLDPWFSITGRPLNPAFMARALLLDYDNGEEVVETGLRYMVTRWPVIRERFSRAPVAPTFGFFVAVHHGIIPEAWVETRKADQTSRP
jgi:hypothetical protein